MFGAIASTRVAPRDVGAHAYQPFGDWAVKTAS